VTVKTLHQRCAGLDVHKQEVVACLRLATKGRVQREVRRFPTTTRGLLELADWLEAARCTIVAMEATGVYWKPVWHILEGRFELVLANAAHIKGVPGRKSDVNDATWIADLLAHGLIRASFVPPQPIQELRDLTRTRKQLSREIVQHTQRLQAVLEEANVKLTSAITDILGASGRRILKAMIAGETDPTRLAELGSPRLGCTRDTLVEALDGRVREHHRFLLDQHLKTIEQMEETVAVFDARIEAALAPFRDTVERLRQVPGLSTTAAEVLIAEIGLDMSRFPTAGHLLSWAGLVPGLDESAGKRRSTRVTGAMRLGGGAQKGQLLRSSVPAPQGTPRSEEGGDRGRRLDPDHRLPHAPRRHLLLRPRTQPLHPPRSGPHRSQARRSHPEPRLRRRN
jgi:transposase